jgi:hypothetical protein
MGREEAEAEAEERREAGEGKGREKRRSRDAREHQQPEWLWGHSQDVSWHIFTFSLGLVWLTFFFVG